jgi:hypothetical protein
MRHPSSELDGKLYNRDWTETGDDFDVPFPADGHWKRLSIRKASVNIIILDELECYVMVLRGAIKSADVVPPPRRESGKRTAKVRVENMQQIRE